MKRNLAICCLAGLAVATLAAQAQTPQNPPYSTSGGAAAAPSVPMVYSATCGCFVPADASNPLQVSASVSASIAAFAPGATVTLSVTASSARVAFGDGNPTALIENSGSSDAFINFGNGTVTATTAMTRVPAGAVVALNVGSNADIAAITASGTTSLTITTGTGVPVVGLSGSGGASANASVGATGAAVPGSATYLGAIVGGNLTGLAATANGLKIDGSAVTQPVSGSVSAAESGTWTVQPGNTANTTPWLASINDGTNTAKIEAASATPAAADKALLVAQSPNSLGCAGASIANTSFTPVSLTANTQVIAGTAAKQTYICHIDLVAAAADNVAVIEGTGAVCGTSPVGIFGGASAATGWNLAANGGIAAGTGQGIVGKTATAADNVCILVSGAAQVSGMIVSVQF